MRQQHDPRLEGAESALVATHDDTGATNGLAATHDAELGGNHEHVVFLLLVAELLEHGDLLRALLESLRTELLLAVVHEATVAGTLESREYELECLAVRGCEVSPARDEEVPLRVGRAGAVREALVVRLELRELALEIRHLLSGGVRLLVAREVAESAVGLLVGELVCEGEATQQGDELETDRIAALLDEALHCALVEAELLERSVGGVLDEASRVLVLTFRSGYGRDRFDRHRRILLPPQSCGAPNEQLCWRNIRLAVSLLQHCKRRF